MGGEENHQSDQIGFDKADANFMNIWDVALAFMESFQEPEAKEEDDHAAIAMDTKRQLFHLFKDWEEELVEAEANVEKPPTHALQNHVESLLRAAEQEQQKALILTRELAGLKPDQADTLKDSQQEKHTWKKPGSVVALLLGPQACWTFGRLNIVFLG